MNCHGSVLLFLAYLTDPGDAASWRMERIGGLAAIGYEPYDMRGGYYCSDGTTISNDVLGDTETCRDKCDKAQACNFFSIWTSSSQVQRCHLAETCDVMTRRLDAWSSSIFRKVIAADNMVTLMSTLPSVLDTSQIGSDSSSTPTSSSSSSISSSSNHDLAARPQGTTGAANAAASPAKRAAQSQQAKPQSVTSTQKSAKKGVAKLTNPKVALATRPQAAFAVPPSGYAGNLKMAPAVPAKSKAPKADRRARPGPGDRHPKPGANGTASMPGMALSPKGAPEPRLNPKGAPEPSHLVHTGHKGGKQRAAAAGGDRRPKLGANSTVSTFKTQGPTAALERSRDRRPILENGTEPTAWRPSNMKAAPRSRPSTTSQGMKAPALARNSHLPLLSASLNNIMDLVGDLLLIVNSSAMGLFDATSLFVTSLVADTPAAVLKDFRAHRGKGRARDVLPAATDFFAKIHTTTTQAKTQLLRDNERLAKQCADLRTWLYQWNAEATATFSKARSDVAALEGAIAPEWRRIEGYGVAVPGSLLQEEHLKEALTFWPLDKIKNVFRRNQDKFDSALHSIQAARTSARKISDMIDFDIAPVVKEAAQNVWDNAKSTADLIEHTCFMAARDACAIIFPSCEHFTGMCGEQRATYDRDAGSRDAAEEKISKTVESAKREVRNLQVACDTMEGAVSGAREWAHKHSA